MQNQQSFDVITKNNKGDEIKLGRTWLKQKDGKFSLSFDLGSLPLSGADVVLKSVEKFDESDCPRAFYLKVPLESGEDNKTYWHQVGRVQSRPGDTTYPFSVSFESLPTTGRLVAFDAMPKNKPALTQTVPF